MVTSLSVTVTSVRGAKTNCKLSKVANRHKRSGGITRCRMRSCVQTL
jgi:hypothetical protein